MMCIALLGSCASISTGSHFDETTNFDAYKSFAWMREDPHIATPSVLVVSPLTHTKIRDAIRQQLAQKGYYYLERREHADFVVSYTIGARDEIRVNSYPVDYRGEWGWHVPYSYYFVRETSTHTYTKGTLGVDLFDNASKKPVWHGWAEKTITEADRADPTETIEAGVAKLFANFPH